MHFLKGTYDAIGVSYGRFKTALQIPETVCFSCLVAKIGTKDEKKEKKKA
jgi:hypothetical protein